MIIHIPKTAVHANGSHSHPQQHQYGNTSPYANRQVGPAEEILVQLLEGRRRVLYDERRDMLSSAENLALVYDNKGLLEAAEQLHLQVLEARKKILKDGDLEIHESMKNSALTYWGQSRWKNAEILLVQPLESRSEALGNGHPETAGVWLKDSRYRSWVC